MEASWKIDVTVKTLKEHKKILDEIEHRLDEYMVHIPRVYEKISVNKILL